MTARQPYADQCTRVYTRTGKVAHLMSPVQSIRNGSVLCNRILPEWFTEWHGTGSQGEIELAASLPLCKRCEDQAQREDEYYSEPSQFTDPADGNPRDARGARETPPPGSAGRAAPVAPVAGAAHQTSPPAVAPSLPGPEETPDPGTGEADPGIHVHASPGRGRTQRRPGVGEAVRQAHPWPVARQ